MFRNWNNIPIPFTSIEKERIKNKLQVAAEKSLIEVGAKKTTVDNLVKAV